MSDFDKILEALEAATKGVEDAKAKAASSSSAAAAAEKGKVSGSLARLAGDNRVDPVHALFC